MHAKKKHQLWKLGAISVLFQFMTIGIELTLGPKMLYLGWFTNAVSLGQHGTNRTTGYSADCEGGSRFEHHIRFLKSSQI